MGKSSLASPRWSLPPLGRCFSLDPWLAQPVQLCRTTFSTLPPHATTYKHGCMPGTPLCAVLWGSAYWDLETRKWPPAASSVLGQQAQMAHQWGTLTLEGGEAFLGGIMWPPLSGSAGRSRAHGGHECSPRDFPSYSHSFPHGPGGASLTRAPPLAWQNPGTALSWNPPSWLHAGPAGLRLKGLGAGPHPGTVEHRGKAWG